MAFYSVPISFSGPGDHTIVVAGGAGLQIKRLDFRVDGNTNVTIKEPGSHNRWCQPSIPTMAASKRMPQLFLRERMERSLFTSRSLELSDDMGLR